MGSTEPTKKAVWGEYTAYKKLKNSGDCEDIEDSIITNDYVDKYGLSGFDSQCLKTSQAVKTNEFKEHEGIWIRTKRTPTEELPYNLTVETEKLAKKREGKFA